MIGIRQTIQVSSCITFITSQATFYPTLQHFATQFIYIYILFIFYFFLKKKKLFTLALDGDKVLLSYDFLAYFS